MSDEDKVIKFPGKSAAPKSTNGPAAPASGRVSPPGSGMLGIPGLSEDQEKAIQHIASGATFVMVAIQPTDTGADFFTALDGEAEDLRNAYPHLDGVIARLFDRRGLS